jgi:hypothetical protein
VTVFKFIEPPEIVLVSRKNLFLNPAVMLRLEPKPADPDKPVILTATRTRLPRRQRLSTWSARLMNNLVDES